MGGVIFLNHLALDCPPKISHPVFSIPCLIVPLVLLSVVLAAVWLERWSVPVNVVALGVGTLETWPQLEDGHKPKPG
jgi:hypothetical protein